MRFISKSARYQTCFKRDVTEHFATGESRVIQPMWNVEFKPDQWLAHELEVAKATFANRGMPTEIDEVTPVDSTYRFGTFDTGEFQQQHASEGFDDARRKELEMFLLNHEDYGSTFVMVETPRLAPPWPTYDEFRGVRGLPTAERIAEKVREDGYEVAAVIAYEVANAHRQDVIDALEALTSGPAVTDDELVSA